MKSCIISECPVGHFSKGIKCAKCRNGKFGEKCAETCSCSRSERCDHRVGCITTDVVKPLKDNKIFVVLIIPIIILTIIILTYKYYQKKKHDNIQSTYLTSNVNTDIVKQTVATHTYDEQEEPHLYDDISDEVHGRDTCMEVGEIINQETETISVSIHCNDTCGSSSEENEPETESLRNETDHDHGIDSKSENSDRGCGCLNNYEAISSDNIETHKYLSLESIETSDC
ncbi:unnamed protein product [Mytilus edulis]|uniref:MEGF10_11 n=1 Tax=Mytilus edulis TaxID=6550 RepID=A0A8S3SP03_MYTED|nr:unnamed protein product [Mytilus edulis]